MKIGIYCEGIREGSSEWGNWEGFVEDLAKQNPDIEWEIVEDDEILDSLFTNGGQVK
jgi:hypothetical protein